MSKCEIIILPEYEKKMVECQCEQKYLPTYFVKIIDFDFIKWMDDAMQIQNVDWMSAKLDSWI